MIPSGAVEDCGNSPSRRATCLVDIDEISAPSSSTVPARGFSTRTSARSSVDFPHAFGPDDRGEPAGRDRHAEVARHDGPVVGERQLVGAQRGFGHARPARHSVVSSQAR